MYLELLLSGACVSLAWRGASALNIAQIGTPLRFFRVGPPQSLSESTQFGPITPKQNSQRPNRGLQPAAPRGDRANVWCLAKAATFDPGRVGRIQE